MRSRFSQFPLSRFFSSSIARANRQITPVLIEDISSLAASTNVIRGKEKSTLTVDLSEQLKNAPNEACTISLKVHVFKVNGSVPPIQITSGDCSAEWLSKERKSLHALNAEYYEHDGIVVKINSGTSFTLNFGAGVYVDAVYGMSITPASGNIAQLKM
jgi:hypothetical protein